MDPENPKYDRLLLNPERLKGITDDLRNVAALPSPLNIALEARTLDNGLDLSRVTVPLGIIGIIYESRPNVTFDVFSLLIPDDNHHTVRASETVCNLYRFRGGGWDIKSNTKVTQRQHSSHSAKERTLYVTI